MMKTSIKAVLLVVTVFIAAACSSGRMMTEGKADITPLTSAVVPEGSLVYALPLTVLDIIIETERSVQKPGPYAAYAGDLLGLRDVIKTDSEHWTVKGITVKTHEELDPSAFYIIQAESVFLTNILSLKKEGLILDLNPDLYDRESISSRLNPAGTSTQHVYDLGSDEYFQSRSDTLYKLVNVDTSFIRIPYLVEKKQKLSLDQLAEKAAGRLMELRDGKHLILTGETNVFPQNDAAINEINRLEKDYLELFTGKTWKEKRTFTYQVIPGKDQAGKPIPVCAFSEKTGPATTAGKDGIAVQVELIPEHKTKELTFLADQQKSQSNRLFYRVPEVVTVKISFGNEPVSTARKLVYQMGDIMQLPSNYLIGK